MRDRPILFTVRIPLGGKRRPEDRRRLPILQRPQATENRGLPTVARELRRGPNNTDRRRRFRSYAGTTIVRKRRLRICQPRPSL
jgi:hypothetical protein